MQEITVTMTLKEAADATMLLSKADPLGVFTGALLRRVDAAARDAMAKAKPPKTAPDNDLQPTNPVVQSSEK